MYSREVILLMTEVKKEGLNIWAMLGLFKRRSKLKPDIPDEVIKKVCLQYLHYKEKIDNSFPYFLQVLKRESEQYFARENIRLHNIERRKVSPILRDILLNIIEKNS